MTDEEIWRDYLDRERKAAKTIKGQNPRLIIETMAGELDRPYDEIKAIILDRTVNGAN